eukprot:scaffold45_cov337-Pavlova_lutheri.AAC.22
MGQDGSNSRPTNRQVAGVDFIIGSTSTPSGEAGTCRCIDASYRVGERRERNPLNAFGCDTHNPRRFRPLPFKSRVRTGSIGDEPTCATALLDGCEFERFDLGVRWQRGKVSMHGN